MTGREVTLREWADHNGWSLDTVKTWLRMYERELTACRSRLAGRTWLYHEDALDTWKRGRPSLGLGRGGHTRPLAPPPAPLGPPPKVHRRRRPPTE